MHHGRVLVDGLIHRAQAGSLTLPRANFAPAAFEPSNRGCEAAPFWLGVPVDHFSWLRMIDVLSADATSAVAVCTTLSSDRIAPFARFASNLVGPRLRLMGDAHPAARPQRHKLGMTVKATRHAKGRRSPSADLRCGRIREPPDPRGDALSTCDRWVGCPATCFVSMSQRTLRRRSCDPGGGRWTYELRPGVAAANRGDLRGGSSPFEDVRHSEFHDPVWARRRHPFEVCLPCLR